MFLMVRGLDERSPRARVFEKRAAGQAVALMIRNLQDLSLGSRDHSRAKFTYPQLLHPIISNLLGMPANKTMATNACQNTPAKGMPTQGFHVPFLRLDSCYIIKMFCGDWRDIATWKTCQIIYYDSKI